MHRRRDGLLGGEGKGKCSLDHRSVLIFFVLFLVLPFPQPSKKTTSSLSCTHTYTQSVFLEEVLFLSPSPRVVLGSRRAHSIQIGSLSVHTHLHIFAYLRDGQYDGIVIAEPGERPLRILGNAFAPRFNVIPDTIDDIRYRLDDDDCHFRVWCIHCEMFGNA